MTEPEVADCARQGCGHSSDAHVYSGPRAARITVTTSAGCWPCEECDCVTMIRSPENYRALIRARS